MPHKQKSNLVLEGSPIGNKEAEFIGQTCFDKSNNKVYTSTGLTDQDWELTIESSGGGSNVVTVGSSGADYDNFDDAIDFLRILNGGTIIVTSNMTITSTATKDVSNIHFIGNDFYSQTRQINKNVNGGYWYGSNVYFSNLWFYRIMDGMSGANEIFKFTEDIHQVRLRWVSCIGIASMSSPAVFNCNNMEAHIDLEYGALGVGESALYVAVSNYSGLVLHLFNNAYAYITGTMDMASIDASARIEGSPTFSTAKNLRDKSSGMENDSGVSGDTVNDALENLNEKNGINGSFTTVDGKTITVVDGQITNITE